MNHRTANIKWHATHVARESREELLGQRGCTIWFTGLPASGKSTTAFGLEAALIELGYLAYVLDGDNVRHGLNGDLGFSQQDRSENIRRIAEVAALFADAGVITLTAFISPFREDRLLAKSIHEEANLPFVEVFVDTPLKVCAERDPKGLYEKALRGEIRGFTGVDDPYEPPLSPDLTVRTADCTPVQVSEQILSYLRSEQLVHPKQGVVARDAIAAAVTAIPQKL